jgi:phospholipase/carboxylesterase
MRAWYDIADLDLSHAEDANGIRESAAQLEALIQTQIDNGIAAEHIVLAGFSQGGAVALHCGLRYPQRLGGILALSTYLPLATTIAAERNSANNDIPIFMAHGQEDEVVPLPHALTSKTLLEQLNYKVDWRSYNMPHSLCDQELEDIVTWLNHTLKN